MVDFQRRQHRLGRACVSTHQAARTQLHAPEITDHDHCHIPDPLVLNDIENGPTRRARRLPIVIHGGTGGPPGRAGHIGPAVMARLGMVQTRPLNQCQRLLPAGGRGRPGDEAALTDLRFRLGFAGRNRPGNTAGLCIGHGAQYPLPFINRGRVHTMQARLEQRSFLFLLLIVTALFLYLMQPFFGAIFWACAIAIIFFPAQRYFTRLWGERPNLTALATLAFCLTIVILPTLFVAASFVFEGVNLYQQIQAGEIDPRAFIDRIGETVPFVGTALESFGVDIESLRERAVNAVMQGGQFFAQSALNIGQNTARFFIHFGVMLYLAFFLLRDGSYLRNLIGQAVPLSREREQLLLGKFAEVTRATIKGNVVIAAIQGLLGGFIFWALALPAAVLWGVVMGVLSLIPAVGAGLIWVPAAIYLFAIGNWIQSVVLVLFGTVVIGLIDNLLRPVLVGRDTKLPDYMVLLSTLGGLILFGINGFVIGPLIAALFTAFWGIFIRDFKHTDNQEA